jgi:hypothetical protein
VSVFLRWGVFGILGVAALLYAYNASKRLAEAHTRKAPPPVAEQPSAEPGPARESEPPVEATAPKPVAPAIAVPARCETELTVARRALEMKQQGEPLDRVLRMQEIAWEESPDRRKRLEQVATRYYGYEGSFRPDALRSAVINDCQGAAPAP